MLPDSEPKFSTLAVHAGEDRQKHGHALTDPIFCSSTYSFADTRAVIDFIEQKQQRDEYGRYGNPNERVAERKLAALEGAEFAVLYSSGMAAIVGLLMAKLNSGDEVVFFDECYHRSREFCTAHLARFGVVTRQVPACDYDAMEAAIGPRTKLLISESPTNPHLSVVDLERFAAIGKRHGVETLIDATLATPYNIRPLEAGIDYVLHSATKYLAGHNDLLAGVILGSKAQLESVRKLRGIMGAVNSPHNNYLLLRGLKTFALRMQRHNENGLRVAQFLATHSRIERVFYPGLETHPYYAVAAKSMRGFGGLVTFQIKDADWRATADVVDAVKIPRIAPSLGGAESLIEQPLVMSYYECTPADRQRFGIFDNMIRLACGLENPEDLVADLAQALDTTRESTMQFRTRAIHVGNPRDPQTGAVVAPIHLSATFVQPGAGEWGEFDYSRSGNPTRRALETTLASLESGTGALAFSSGMAAIHAAMMILETGDHVVAGRDIYGGTYRLLHNILDRAGITVTLVDSTNPAAIEAAMSPRTRLLWVESPGNPLMTITDIADCARIARRHNALLGVDNTFATPVLTRPLELGADIVMHSATKYLGGHSDVLGGALIVKDRSLYDRLYYVQNATGAVLGPLESYLCSRGIKTLELRVREQCRSALKLAQFLMTHPRVARVLYPGLLDHPGHDVATRQMDGAFGAMITFEVGGSLAETKRVAESTKLFQLAVSLGAVESLIEQPATMSHASYDAADRAAHGISDGLVRISVGLEAWEDLRDDLSHALA